MLWVTDMAPEPPDVFWANLCVPYKLLWVRKLGVYLASSILMVFFFVPVSFVQSLVYLDRLKENFLFVRRLSEKKYVILSGSIIYILMQYVKHISFYGFHCTNSFPDYSTSYQVKIILLAIYTIIPFLLFKCHMIYLFFGQLIAYK